MISELDRKILTKACGLEPDKYWFCLKCYKELPWTHVTYEETCTKCGSPVIEKGGIPDFTTPDSWELVRVKVVVPNIKEFDDFEWDRWMTEWKDTDTKNFFSWWSIKTPQDRCNEGLLFIKSRPDLFPWVVELIPMDGLMMEEKR